MSTINKEEIQKFENIADDWWNPEGKFKPIHKFNPVRISFIIEVLKSHFNLKHQSSMPLKNLRILDLGCGPGYFSLELARAGFQVVGVDISDKMISIANKNLKSFRNKKNFSRADEIRDELKSMGIEIEDTPDGTIWRNEN